MGYYDAEISGGLRLPSVVLAEMRTVDAGIKALGADIQRYANANRLPDGFMSEWIAFRIEWEAFYKDNSGLLDRITNAAYDKTIEFRERLQSWRDNFVRVGGAPTAPALPKTGWPIGAIVIGTVIVGGVLWYLFKVDHS